MDPPSSLLSVRHPLIRLFHLGPVPNHLQPLSNLWIVIQLQLSIRILIDPRIEMRIHGAETTRQHALPTTLPQLSFQHVKGPVRLRFISCQSVLVLSGVVVPIPVQLAHHRPESADEKEFPFVKVNVVLFGWFGTAACAPGTQRIGFVVYAQQVMDHGAAFPGYDSGVGILESGHAAVLVDLEEVGAFDAVGCIAEFPEFDGVGELEGGENYGHLIRIGSRTVG